DLVPEPAAFVASEQLVAQGRVAGQRPADAAGGGEGVGGGGKDGQQGEEGAGPRGALAQRGGGVLPQAHHGAGEDQQEGHGGATLGLRGSNDTALILPPIRTAGKDDLPWHRLPACSFCVVGRLS